MTSTVGICPRSNLRHSEPLIIGHLHSKPPSNPLHDNNVRAERAYYNVVLQNWSSRTASLKDTKILYCPLVMNI
jgi:hypothetical protein